MRLLPELVKSDISALRKIQSSNRFFPNKDGKTNIHFNEMKCYIAQRRDVRRGEKPVLYSQAITGYGKKKEIDISSSAYAE